MARGLTARQMVRLQAEYFTDVCKLERWEQRNEGKDVWKDLGLCSCKVIERATVAYKGTAQAQAADGTVEIMKAPQALTDRNQRFRLTVDVIASEVENEATETENPAPPRTKRTVKYEVAQAEIIRDLGGSDLVISCRVVLSRAVKGA